MYNPKELAVYIHWPFCKSKCPYCNFYKQLAINVNQDEIVAEYINALQKYHNLTAERTVKSIFFGGGTPSLLSAENIAKIIDSVSGMWHLKENAEVSLEANPNTEHPHLFADLKNAGINRLSLGVQALDDKDLRFLGRTHNVMTAERCLEKVVKTFSNHSADLIYALPDQSEENWCSQLQKICSFGLTHLSAYELTIEENTVFAHRNIQPCQPERAAKLSELTAKTLAACGYEHYEISNYAKHGFQSNHNLVYWQGGDYIGIGKSAHGRLHLNNRLIATEYPFKHEKLQPEERAEELLLMGLRLTKGINKADFYKICGLNLHEFINRQKLTELKKMQLIKETGTYLRATESGLLLVDELVRQLCI